jgi:hypothetical protein
MPDSPSNPPEHTDYTPDFELPRHGAIREDNWAQFQARGFRPVIGGLGFAQVIYGVEHVYTGDPYDYMEERPLHHRPGIGVYADPDGLTRGEEWMRKHHEWLRERGYTDESSGGGPGNS